VAFGLDGWQVHLSKGIRLDNDLYAVGNSSDGLQPFGLICDLRIYAYTLAISEIRDMVFCSLDLMPDSACRRLNECQAACAISSCLEEPDAQGEVGPSRTVARLFIFLNGHRIMSVDRHLFVFRFDF
jgi:hypothetical protein